MKVKDGHSIPPKLAVLCYSDETQNKESNRLLFQITDTMAMELSHFLFVSLVVSIPHADKKMARNAAIDIYERYQADYMLVFYIQQLPKKHHKLLVRLMDVSDETVLWSESYKLKDDEPFDGQHEIIGSITAVIADIQQGILHRHWARKLLENEGEIDGEHKALAYYRYYSDTLGIDAFKKAVRVCEEQLEKKPNDIICKVLYADYCRRDYVYGFGVIDAPLKTGKKCAQDAVRLRPDSHEAHFVLGQILFCLNERERSLSELNLARDICRYHAYVEYGIGFNFCLLGKWDEGWAVVKRVMTITPNYPSWFNIVPFLYYYRQSKYDDALHYALKIDVPIIFHGVVARCVCYAQLGEQENAKKEFQELLERFPQFMEEGKGLLTRFLGSEELAESLWEGIEKTAKITSIM